jgi:hypothetical protein
MHSRRLATFNEHRNAAGIENGLQGMAYYDSPVASGPGQYTIQVLNRTSACNFLKGGSEDDAWIYPPFRVVWIRCAFDEISSFR